MNTSEHIRPFLNTCEQPETGLTSEPQRPTVPHTFSCTCAGPRGAANSGRAQRKVRPAAERTAT
eukprot:6918675-Alexandrium_andersonii.AAC.1